VPDDDRRRPEGLPRERLWTEEEREAFRRGLSERRSPSGNGVEAQWSHDMKSVRVDGRDTVIIVMLSAILSFLGWANWEGFKAIAQAHTQIYHQGEDFKCLLALPQDERLNAVRHTGGTCDYLFSNKR
jgi:hypothetical protein